MGNLDDVPARQIEGRRCEVCRDETFHEFVYEKWKYQIVRCVTCGLGSVLVDEFFNPSDIYDESYFQGGRSDGYSDYAGSEEVLRTEFRRTLSYITRFARKGGRLLEVGCAYGFFLAEAQRYYDCVGIEIAENAVKFCQLRGLNVSNYSLDSNFIHDKAPYDIIMMLDVIEHLPNPSDVISSAGKIMREGGTLVITTGDWESWLARIMGKAWRLMTPPQHLFYFSRRTLSQLLSCNGFEVMDFSHPWRVVPFGLAAYQLSSRLGIELPDFAGKSGLGFPINLYDSMRVTARKRWRSAE